MRHIFVFQRVHLNNFDLHNHTTASDGAHSPSEVVVIAKRNGCDALAITDHDTTAGLAEATTAATHAALPFIPGVEISVSWAANIDSKATTIHIVGLNIDPANAALQAGLLSIRAGRASRAIEMGDSFAAAGHAGMTEAAYAFAANKEMIGRTHFARVLVERKVVKNIGHAFERFLTRGKPGYVAHAWASLADAVKWITGAGGIAVMAHPGRYNLPVADMTQLLTEFSAAGGTAIEVVTGSHAPRDFRTYAVRAKEFGFLASRGADFHGLGESKFEPGSMPPLPDDVTPVWTRLPEFA